jgi:hypothetical protein
MKRNLVDPRDTTGLDVSHLLTPEHRAHMAGLGRRYAQPSGLFMGPNPDDADDDEDEEEEDEPLELDPSDIVKVGNKTMTVRELQRIAATEKKQGKRAGQSAVLKRLGFDTVEDAEAALAGAKPPVKKKADEGEDDGEEERRQRDRDEERRRERAAAAAKERKLDLRGALRDAGVSRADLDAGEALLDRLVDADYDEDDLEDAVERLQETRAGKALFADGEDDQDDKPERRTTGKLPAGRPKRRNQPPAKKQGQAGRSRAERKGWIKTDI